jgi:hypothetical protein
VVRWLHSLNTSEQWNERVCSSAATGGDLSLLQWLRSIGVPWDSEVTAEAAKEGHLHILSWARDNGCPWHPYVAGHAASRGHLEVFLWLIRNGAPWSGAIVCAAAAGGGHLPILQWARLQSEAWESQFRGRLPPVCPFRFDNPFAPPDRNICESAAARGHLHILRWAASNDVSLSIEACKKVATRTDVRSWLDAQQQHALEQLDLRRVRFEWDKQVRIIRHDYRRMCDEEEWRGESMQTSAAVPMLAAPHAGQKRWHSAL